MALFIFLIQAQVVGLVLCGFVLRWSFPRTAQAMIDKNSRRIDGSFSRRRHRIEIISINHAFARVYVGLFFVLAATSIAGLLTCRLELRLPRFDADSEPAHLASKLDPTNESAPYTFRWPLIAVYVVSTFMVAPQLISTLYQSAIKRYISHGNMRFREYFLAEWMEMQVSEAEDENALQNVVQEHLQN